MKLTIRFNDAESAFVKQQAERKGVAPSAMCKEYVLDRLGRNPIGERPWEKLAEIEKKTPPRRSYRRRRQVCRQYRYKRAVTPLLGCRGEKNNR